MRRILCVLATITVINVIGPLMSTGAEERRPEAREAAAPAKAKIGDEVTCAIDGMRMPLQADTPSAEYQGKTYYFCSDTEKQTFLKDPERYTKR